MVSLHRALMILALCATFSVTADTSLPSGAASKYNYYERCLMSIEQHYYDCKCLDNEYVKQKTANPALSDYNFVQGTAYKKCFDAEAAAKSETKACEVFKVPVFDCNCSGKTYVEMVKNAGVPLLGSRQEKALKHKALSACMVTR